VAFEILRLALPVLLTFIVCVFVLPTGTLPKLALAGTRESCGCSCTAAPDSAIIAGEFVALLTTETLPVTLPTAVGAKAIFNEAFCPAAKVRGSVSPLAVKPAPETLSCEMLTLELPVLLKVTVWLPLLPTFTFPKLNA